MKGNLINNDDYNSEFDERDQKQNVGQIGDTSPPDDSTPTEDELSNINETSPLNDTSRATGSAENDREEARGIDLNRNETGTSHPDFKNTFSILGFGGNRHGHDFQNPQKQKTRFVSVL